MKVRRYMFRLLKHAFVTQQHLSSDMDAVAIWLAHPQGMTLDSLDVFQDAGKKRPAAKTGFAYT
jgi:hypothetical protein